MKNNITWPRLIFPPINLWNFPKISIDYKVHNCYRKSIIYEKEKNTITR